MTPEELHKKYSDLTLLRNITVEELNEILEEQNNIRIEYKSLTGKEMLIN